MAMYSQATIHSYQTIIVGTGAAAFHAANELYELGQSNIAIVTEGIKKGTSRNTGSDKQTYYKMSTSGANGDSPYHMAKTLFSGGAMHGDVALVEASLSAACFYNLVRIGVPFPMDRYGQYVGYKTDHDPYTRASSAGPLTSKYMTEMLERQVMKNEIPIFDGYQVVSILKQEANNSVCGILALNTKEIEEETLGFTLFNCTNVIYCTGGPSCLYASSVFPKSQFGATGVALEAGVKGANLTEWQYGLASTKFRWNVSGTYQQVLPRYVSTNQDMGDERDFLCDYFDSYSKMCDAIFLKGYEWPFDPRKIANQASSCIDILVYIETQIRGRRVFMDFTKNPTYAGTDDKELFTSLSAESYRYLENSGALFGTPIERLEKMNPLAITLYQNNGIDIRKEYLEIDVCAQHNNGGLQGNIWWESGLKGFFPVGEVAGTLGVYRPGGSALNATQVGGLRAATYIRNRRNEEPMQAEVFFAAVRDQVEEKWKLAKKIKIDPLGTSNVMSTREKMQKSMTKTAAFFRAKQKIADHLPCIKKELESLFSQALILSAREIKEVFRNYDMLISQYAYLSAMLEYAQKGGQSRGSYLVVDDGGDLNFSHEELKFSYTLDKKLHDQICVTKFDKATGEVTHFWEAVRPIPKEDAWFENVWADYRCGKIYQ